MWTTVKTQLLYFFVIRLVRLSFLQQHERKVYTDDGIDDEDIEGRREFNVEEKLLSNKYNCNFIQPLKGHGKCPSHVDKL